MQSLTSKFVLLLSAMLFAPRVAAAERVTLLLNWYSTADHSPYYFVKRHGLHGKIGLDVIIESGEVGSSGAARWRPQCGIRRRRCSDSSRSQEQRGQFMVVYANSPQGFHWLKSSGLDGPRDFVGREIGNPPGDAARAMWPAFAKAAGIDPARPPKTYFASKQPFEVAKAYTNEFLDASIIMTER